MVRIDNIFTGRALARDQNISETAIRKAFNAGRLYKIERGKHKGQYDLLDERNRAEIDRIKSNPRSGNRLPKTNKIKETKQKSIEQKKIKREVKTIIENKKRSESFDSTNQDNIDQDSINIDDADLDSLEGIESIDSIVDISNLRILKEREAIKEKQLKNRETRGELVDKKNVAKIFNKLWSVDTSQFQTLATKISPEIASICEIDDIEKITKIRERIDKEIFRILGHSRRILSEYLEKINAGTIEDNEE